MKLLHEKIIVFLGILFISIPAASQVTVGSVEPPVKGALLQLKEIENAPDGDINSTKGLALPRVKLIQKRNADISVTIDGVAPNAYSGDDHTGLVVYNTNQCFDNMGDDKGVYVWNGSEWEFLFPFLGSTSYQFVDSRDGEVYFAGSFGTAGDWMLENLRYVPNNTDTGFTGFVHSIETSPNGTYSKHYAYPDGEGNNASYVPANHPSASWPLRKKNGILYNWYAATNNENNSTANQGEGSGGELSVGPRGICPFGWHLPSDKEWSDLEREIYAKANLYSTYTLDQVSTWSPWDNANWSYGIPSNGLLRYRPSFLGEGHGAAMKSQCALDGSTTLPRGKSFSGIRGGFNALLVGLRSSIASYDKSPYRYGESVDFWTSSNYDPGYNDRGAYHRRMQYNTSAVYRSSHYKDVLGSVRCKKD
ncbi:MAG: FISUMP domain-containing protein [Dysgonomonas sp.]